MDCNHAAAELTDGELWLLAQVNTYRFEAGMHPVLPNPKLQCAAQWQVEQTILSGEQSHMVDGLGPNDRAQACGYSEGVYENVSAWNATVSHADGRLEASTVHAAIRRRSQVFEAGVALAFDYIRTTAVGGYDGGTHFPLALTEVYGKAKPTTVAGFVYYDANGNGTFDISEGIGNIVLHSDADCAITSASGLFEFPRGAEWGKTLETYFDLGIWNEVKIDVNLEVTTK